MTEADWLASEDLDALLDHLLAGPEAARKLRLLACACCMPLWRLVKARPCQQAFEVALRFADGLAEPAELEAAWRAGLAAQPLFPDIHAAAVAAADPNLVRAVARATQLAADAAARINADPVMRRARAAVASGAEAEHRAAAWDRFESAFAEARHDAQREQVRYLRCLFGNPFRPVVIDPHWRNWNGGTLVQMAQAIDADRRFGDLPILADALEEAGCTDDEIIGHCRHDWEHFRGCHVLDALLAKV
jgi:hypothetical protein